MKNSDELTIMHEPFTDYYYYGPDRKSCRYGDFSDTPASAIATSAVEELILLGDQGRRTFVKELAFQGEPYVSDTLLKASRNVLITRHPKAVYASLSRLKPDFTEDEFGFTALSRVCRRICELTEAPYVIDGDDFRAEADSITSAACDYIRIKYSPDFLVWKDGNIRAWNDWEAKSQKVWHRTLEHSSTILKPTTLPEITVKSEHSEWFSRAMNIFSILKDRNFQALI